MKIHSILLSALFILPLSAMAEDPPATGPDLPTPPKCSLAQAKDLAVEALKAQLEAQLKSKNLQAGAMEFDQANIWQNEYKDASGAVEQYIVLFGFKFKGTDVPKDLVDKTILEQFNVSPECTFLKQPLVLMLEPTEIK